MAGDSFSVQTCDGASNPIGLRFTREMLAGEAATLLPPTRSTRGTTIMIDVRDQATFELLIESYSHWCRDVSGLTASVLPENRELRQRSSEKQAAVQGFPTPDWIDRAHLSPVSGLSGWEATMTGESTISVLYRGVFVQEFDCAPSLGIDGVDRCRPKTFQTSPQQRRIH